MVSQVFWQNLHNQKGNLGVGKVEKSHCVGHQLDGICDSNFIAVNNSARSSSLFIELQFHRVSNCRVRTCMMLNFCSSNMSFSGYIELEFSRV